MLLLMSTITVTFGWDELGEEERAGRVPLTLQMDKSALAERDPDGTSLLSCKDEFCEFDDLLDVATWPWPGRVHDTRPHRVRVGVHEAR